MIKNLLLALFAVLGLSSVQAKEVTVTINVDRENAVQYNVNEESDNVVVGSTTITFTAENSTSWGGTKSLFVGATNDWKITSMTYQYAGSETAEEGYYNDYSKGYYVPLENDVVINITTASLAELRTNTLTVNVDDASKVKFCRGYNDRIELQNGANTIKFADDETEYSIDANGYGNVLNEVKLNGEVQNGEYGYYLQVKDGDVIDITALFPDEEHTFSLTVTGIDNPLDLISSLNINDEPVDLATADLSHITFKAGDNINFQAITTFYTVNSFTVNGVAESFYGYWGKSGVKEDLTLVLDVTKKETESATVHIDHPEFFTVYASQWGWGEGLAPQADGSFKIEWLTGEENTCFSLNLKAHAKIISVKKGDVDITAETVGYNGNAWAVANGDEIYVTSEKMEALGDYAIIFHNGNVNMEEARMDTYGAMTLQEILDTTNGKLNVYELFEGDNEFSLYFNTDNYDGDSKEVYLNNTKANSDSWSACYYSFNGTDNSVIANGDILRIYIGEEAAQALETSININSAIAESFSAKIDGYKAIDLSDPIAEGEYNTNPASVMSLAKVNIYCPEGKEAADYLVKVGDAELPFADGCWTAEAGNTVTVDYVPVAVNELRTNLTEDDAIYNLQGIRVNAGNLSQGVYVKNGKKVVLK